MENSVVMTTEGLFASFKLEVPKECKMFVDHLVEKIPAPHQHMKERIFYRKCSICPIQTRGK